MYLDLSFLDKRRPYSVLKVEGFGLDQHANGVDWAFFPLLRSVDFFCFFPCILLTVSNVYAPGVARGGITLIRRFAAVEFPPVVDSKFLVNNAFNKASSYECVISRFSAPVSALTNIYHQYRVPFHCNHPVPVNTDQTTHAP